MKIISAYIEGYGSRQDKSLKIILGSQEASPDLPAFCQQHLNKLMLVAIKEDPFEAPELDLIDKAVAEYSDTTKSPSKRLKDVLYRTWEQVNAEGFTDFTDYYRAKIDKFINHYKSKLP